MRRAGGSSTPAIREKAQARLRTLTRGVIVAATALTALIGVVVAREHPGAGSTRHDDAGSARSRAGSPGTQPGSPDGATMPTTPAPSVSSSRPTVTSGGSSP